MWSRVLFGAVFVTVCSARPGEELLTGASAPVVSITVDPVISTTVTPVISTTATPDISSTVTPDITTTATPDISSTVTPVISTTATPDISTTATPDISSTVTPGVVPSTVSKVKESNEVEVSVIERFPHAVLLSGTCGGTVIAPRWVLSAAHCTLFMSGRSVLAGTAHSLSGQGELHRIKRHVVHPRFSVGPYWLNPRTYNISQVAARYDFLLTELETPLSLNGKTIVAATLDTELKHPGGIEVGYAGYGAEHHGDSMRHDMHGMEMETLEDEVCAKQLEQFDADDMLCARGRPPRYDSACNGDSGSGLVDGAGRLLGVASWVEDDALRCFNGAVVVFSRVARVRDWIRQVTGV